MDNSTKTICGVCGGKGGWKKDVKNLLDDNWIDCPLCEGYGFIEVENDNARNEAYIFKYNHYKKLITDLLSENVCAVLGFTTDDMGETIRIRVTPHNKTRFAQFIDYVLKVSHYSTRIEISLAQKYYYDKKHDKCFFYWELELKAKEFSDLDGFVDAIRIWERVM